MMLPVLSERLKTAAGLVPEQSVLADVGTDHGYVPIWLCGRERIKSAIATDINRGPLERAREHIRRYGMEERIQTRLSDGVAAIRPGEADAVLIAGMGGGLVMHILEAGEAVCRQASLVLQPQSEIARVREYLLLHGYVTDAEEMVEEDGKFYPMMRVRDGREAGGVQNDEALRGLSESDRIGLRYGALLAENRHPVLLRYARKERDTYQKIRENLGAQRQTEQICGRIREVEDVLALNQKLSELYGE